MSFTKALGILNFVTARGLDNGDGGALKLSNQVQGAIPKNIPYGGKSPNGGVSLKMKITIFENVAHFEMRKVQTF